MSSDQKLVRINGERTTAQFVKVNGNEVLSPFRSLKNYKAIHKSLAAKKGVSVELEQATTLTQARRVVFG